MMAHISKTNTFLSLFETAFFLLLERGPGLHTATWQAIHPLLRPRCPLLPPQTPLCQPWMPLPIHDFTSQCCSSNWHRPLPACGRQSWLTLHEGRVTDPAGLACHLVLQTLFWEAFSPPGNSHLKPEWETDHTLISSLWERCLSLLFTTKTSRPTALLAPRKLGTLAALQALPTATGKSQALGRKQQMEAPYGGWPMGKGYSIYVHASEGQGKQEEDGTCLLWSQCRGISKLNTSFLVNGIQATLTSCTLSNGTHMGSAFQGQVWVGVRYGCGFLEEVRSPVTPGKLSSSGGCSQGFSNIFWVWQRLPHPGAPGFIPAKVLLSHWDLGSHQVMDNPEDPKLKEIAWLVELLWGSPFVSWKCSSWRVMRPVCYPEKSLPFGWTI